MKLRTPSYLVLGMLRLGARSGYAIKKATDVSTRFFWPTSLAQVYPELARLERHGYVERHEDPQGARVRSAYELTDAGTAALTAWLSAAHDAPVQFRSEAVLRLYLADALAHEEQLALVRRLRQQARREGERMRREIIPLAEALAQSGPRYPAVVARLGADTYGYVEGWLATLEA
jgi:DNA-binding PadR family transcriptional regulator